MRKIVCVFGCNGGIGKEICSGLRNENYYIIGVDKNKFTNDNIDEFYQIDLSSTENVSSTCNYLLQIENIWGLVFASGIYPIRKFDDYTSELWDEVININLKSCFIITKEIYRNILAGGRIVFISSGASFLGSQDIGYSVSKAALLGLAKGLAKIFAPRIMVNTICPGLIETKMSNEMEMTRKKETIDRTLLSRIGLPQEIVSAVLFLLDSNNSYMTGANIDVNGGLY